jgi:signal transduction histidine kinase
MFLLEEERAQTHRMRAHMVEKQKMVAIGQMAAGVAHEIGNPLSSISSIAQMLRRGGISDAQSAQVDLIETHVQRISTIVRQLSRLSRPSVAKWEPVDIGRVLDEAVRLISFDRRSRDIEIDLLLPPKPLPSTYGLRGELQQVFINLSLNAMDAMREGGRLTVRAEQNLRHIAVHIKDTGKGIAEDIGRRVFDPFFTTKQPGEGTGLGLAVSYNIVQKHGGTIDFVSAAGEGTEFTVLVPRLDEPPGTASAVAAAPDRSSAEDHEEP